MQPQWYWLILKNKNLLKFLLEILPSLFLCTNNIWEGNLTHSLSQLHSLTNSTTLSLPLSLFLSLFLLLTATLTNLWLFQNHLNMNALIHFCINIHTQTLSLSLFISNSHNLYLSSISLTHTHRDIFIYSPSFSLSFICTHFFSISLSLTHTQAFHIQLRAFFCL